MTKPSKAALADQARRKRERAEFEALPDGPRAELLALARRLGEQEAGLLGPEEAASVLGGDEDDLAADAWYDMASESATQAMMRLGVELKAGHHDALGAAFHTAYQAALAGMKKPAP